MKNIWVLHISHKYGNNLSAHKTKRGARKTLLDYTTKWWSQFCDDAPQPKRDDDKIALYFENASGYECYELTELTLEQ